MVHDSLVALRQCSHRARDHHSDHRPRGARGRAASVDETEYHEHRADKAGPCPLHCAEYHGARVESASSRLAKTPFLRQLIDRDGICKIYMFCQGGRTYPKGSDGLSTAIARRTRMARLGTIGWVPKVSLRQ